MSKTTGFLEYARLERPVISPDIRTNSYDEFHEELSPRHRREQGGRCMNCGVPFCGRSAYDVP